MGPSVVRFLESPRLHSPDIAFGLPGVFMAIATVIFWMGRKKFVHIPPVGLRTYAREIFNKETGKIILNILMPVPFVMIFWALWQQNFSSWIVQAERWIAIFSELIGCRPKFRRSTRFSF